MEVIGLLLYREWHKTEMGLNSRLLGVGSGGGGGGSGAACAESALLSPGPTACHSLDLDFNFLGSSQPEDSGMAVSLGD